MLFMACHVVLIWLPQRQICVVMGFPTTIGTLAMLVRLSQVASPGLVKPRSYLKQDAQSYELTLTGDVRVATPHQVECLRFPGLLQEPHTRLPAPLSLRFDAVCSRIAGVQSTL